MLKIFVIVILNDYLVLLLKFSKRITIFSIIKITENCFYQCNFVKQILQIIV